MNHAHEIATITNAAAASFPSVFQPPSPFHLCYESRITMRKQTDGATTMKKRTGCGFQVSCVRFQAALSVAAGALLVAGMLSAFAPPAQALPSATGGTVAKYIENGTNFTAHIFTTVGTTSITFSVGGDVEYLVVAGGGGGGWVRNGFGGGAGGAGGLLTGSTNVDAVAYSIVVGDGGSGPAGQINNGSPGGNSSFTNIVAIGGGGGVGSNAAYPADGGSGGGGGQQWAVGRLGTPGQGNDGGDGNPASNTPGGGGGGAGAPGQDANAASNKGYGGIGIVSSLRGGTNEFYAAGGGGGGTAIGNRGLGGSQDGYGNGGYGETDATGGRPNTGGGAGGGPSGGSSQATIKGGTGIVIVRYATPLPVTENDPVTDVTTNSATFNGTLVSDGGLGTAVFLLWGEDPNAWANTNSWPVGFWAQGSTPSTNISLSPNKTYYYSFGATNSATAGAIEPANNAPVSFITGAVTVQPTDANAQYADNYGVFTIARPVGSTNLPLTVPFTMAGSEVQNTDYTLSLSGSVTIDAGSTSTVVTLIPTPVGAGTAILKLTLATDNDYPVGAASNATVTIAPMVVSVQQMVITFEGYTGGRPTLTNFPVLVVFSNNVGGSGFNYNNVLSPSGYDLRFVANLGDTGSLNYEIESWDYTGASYAWVQVPEIPGDGTGVIYAEWGDPANSNQLACTTNGTTWSNGYVIVAHMAETSGTTVSDSTTNQNHGTTSGVTLGSSGNVGRGESYDGVGGRNVTFGTIARPNNNFTFSAWTKTAVTHEIDVEATSGIAGTGGEKYAFSPPNEGGDSGAGMSVGNNGVSVYEHGGGYAPALAVYPSSIGTDWNYVSVVYVAKQPSIYVNGLSVHTGLTSPKTTVYAPYITGDANGWGSINGSMDEARVSSVVRSSDWIWAEYLNMSSNTVFSAYEIIPTTKGTMFLLR